MNLRTHLNHLFISKDGVMTCYGNLLLCKFHYFAQRRHVILTPCRQEQFQLSFDALRRCYPSTVYSEQPGLSNKPCRLRHAWGNVCIVPRRKPAVAAANACQRTVLLLLMIIESNPQVKVAVIAAKLLSMPCCGWWPRKLLGLRNRGQWRPGFCSNIEKL